MFDFILDKYNYWIAILLMMLGLYLVISQANLIKKLIGLNIFQTSVFVFYISVGRVYKGTAPILTDGVDLYTNPLPHVLILTAIVVGVATMAVGFALIVRINEEYDNIEGDEISEIEQKEINAMCKNEKLIVKELFPSNKNKERHLWK